MYTSSALTLYVHGSGIKCMRCFVNHPTKAVINTSIKGKSVYVCGNKYCFTPLNKHNSIIIRMTTFL